MDTETFKKVFLSYHRKLYRIAYRMLQDTSNAEDMLQETYIKLWNKRDELENVDNTEAFSIITLRNTCLDYLRKSKDDYYTQYEIDMPESGSLSGLIELNDRAEQVKKLINKLSEPQRQVILLKHWDGYSDDEIEQITGLSASNIRVILSRTRKMIREQFVKIEQI